MRRKYDESWVGKKFGRLTVVEYLSKEGRFVCECVCGNRSVVVPVNLIRGKVKSCGCYNRDIMRERMTVHGEHGTRLYRPKPTSPFLTQSFGRNKESNL